MENIKDILAGAGVEVEADKLAEIEKAVLANYRTKAEADAKTAKVAELEKQLADANAAIETAKSTDTANMAEVEKMREQLEAYEQADAERKAEREQKSARDAFDAKLTDAIGGKRFANAIVQSAVTDKAFAMSQANPNMSVNDVLDAVVGDADGIWQNPQQNINKMPSGGKAAAGSTQSIGSIDDLKNMSVEQIREHMAEVDKVLAAQKG